MNWQIYFRLALTETRKARGRLSFCLFSIALGVASVTAVRTIVLSFEKSIASQTRELMGADLSLSSSQYFPKNEKQKTLLQDLKNKGAVYSRLTRFYSMVQARVPATPALTSSVAHNHSIKASNNKNRTSSMVRVQALTNGFPFYGEVITSPPNGWEKLSKQNNEEAVIIVPPDVLSRLRVSIGDKIKLGQKTFRIIASIVREESSIVDAYSIAPTVYIHQNYIKETDLIQKGSRILYSYLYKVPSSFNVQEWKKKNFSEATINQINIKTYHEAATSLQRFLTHLSDFLTIISLIILLLGGLGVGFSLHVFMKHRQDHVAIFRNIGLGPKECFRIYLILALGLGLIGSILGMIPGTLLPLFLSKLANFQSINKMLPFTLEISFFWGSVVSGILSGISTTLLFVLIPIYKVRSISPIRILRKDTDDTHLLRSLFSRPREAFTLIVSFILLFFLYIALAAYQVSSWKFALYFTILIIGSISVLYFISWLFMRLLALVSLGFSSYRIRQGIANLYRPNNQTSLIIIALGACFLLIGTVFITESSFQNELGIKKSGNTPNNFITNMQPYQYKSVLKILKENNAKKILLSPMLTARISKINGKYIERDKIKSNSVKQSRSDRILNREHFISFRDTLLDSERIIKGSFWNEKKKKDKIFPKKTEQPFQSFQELSVDNKWANEMRVGIGDTITFDVQGIPLQTKITSLRKIMWQAMQPNAMLLLPTEKAKDAPHLFIGSYRVESDSTRLQLQNHLLIEHPNLTIIDVTYIIKSVKEIMEEISVAIRFLSLLTLINGVIILVGTVFSSRFARLHEATLLKVLGATRKDIYRILVIEYCILAFLSCLSGWILLLCVNYFTVDSFLKTNPTIPYLYLLGLSFLVVLSNIIIAVFVSRNISKTSALSILREN